MTGVPEASPDHRQAGTTVLQGEQSYNLFPVPPHTMGTFLFSPFSMDRQLPALPHRADTSKVKGGRILWHVLAQNG